MGVIAYWVISAAVLVVLAGLIGRRASFIGEDGQEHSGGNWLGVLIDERLRFSLTHLQIVLWSLVLLSLLSAIFLTHLVAAAGGKMDMAEVLNIGIPAEILILAGISGGSAVLSTAVKSPRTPSIRAMARSRRLPTRFSQVFLVEEGEMTDKVIDVTKFQNFFLTWIAVIAYVALAATRLAEATLPLSFPGFSQDLLWLIGISHAAYVGGKFPAKE